MILIWNWVQNMFNKTYIKTLKKEIYVNKWNKSNRKPVSNIKIKNKINKLIIFLGKTIYPVTIFIIIIKKLYLRLLKEIFEIEKCL